MRTLKVTVRFLKRLSILLAVILTILFWGLFFSARPSLTIDPLILEGDGSALNYCDLPELDGKGKSAADIPKGNTPGCGFDHFPLPILAECTEALPEEAADIRGLWLGVEGGHVGHVERVEQCGSRVVVTAAGLIHDSGPNSTAGLTTDDTEGAILFKIGEREYCPRTSAEMIWNEGVLNFHVFGWGPVVVRRYMEGEQLIWEYADGSITRMNRLCFLPDEHKYPRKRGPKYQLGWN